MIAVLLVLNAWYVWSTGTRLEQRFTSLREAGEPVQLADLERMPIPPETNAATYLRRAADDLDSMQKELTAWYPQSAYPAVPVPPGDREKIGKLLAAYPKVWPLLEQAAACPNYDPEIDYTVGSLVNRKLDELNRHRSAFRVMRARSAWLVSQGRGDEAIQTMLVMLRLSRHLQREPLLIGYLVAVACGGTAMQGANEVLQSGPVSPASRSALDAELALHDHVDGYRWALRSERASVLAAMHELPGYDFWLMRGMANDATLHALAFFDQQLSDTARPFAEVIAEEKAATQTQRRSGNMYQVVLALLEPAVKAARDAAERVRAMSRSLRVLNALQARATSGDAAPKLSELGLPEEVIRDPFNGQPLKFQRLPDGWMVYSVGRNLTNDGGKLDDATDVGFGPIRPANVQKKP